jgi:CHASE3 domain sensor protein
MKIMVPPRSIVGFIAILSILLAITGFSLLSLRDIHVAAESRGISRTNLLTIESLSSTLQDAETGQRGFLLTGEDRYLIPFNDAIATFKDKIARLKASYGDSEARAHALGSLAGLARQKFEELALTIELRRKSGIESAVAVMLLDRGQKDMAAMRAILDEMQADVERQVRTKSIAFDDAVAATAVATGSASGLAFLLVLLAGYVANGQLLARQRVEASLVNSIRDMKQLENERELFFSISPDMLCIADVSGHFKALNPAFESC